MRYIHLTLCSDVFVLQKKYSGAHSRVATLIQLSFQKNKKQKTK